MDQDRAEWNQKHRNKSSPGTPLSIVRRYHARAAKGIALDIAAGLGRNAVYLAEKGFEVDAVDVSDVAVEKMTDCHPRVHPIRADLDSFDIRPNHYTLIVNVRFLQRRLFPYIVEGLLPGGVLIFETFLLGARKVRTAASSRDYYLRANELLRAFLSLRIIYYQETVSQGKDGCGPLARLVGVKPS